MRIYINEIVFHKLGVNISGSNFDNAMVDYLQDNYFNGADNAVIYIGYTYINDYQVFEFEIMPN